MSFTSALTPFIDRGMRVQTSEVRDKFGLSDPPPGAEVLGAPRLAPVPDAGLQPNQLAPETGPEFAAPALQQQQAAQKTARGDHRGCGPARGRTGDRRHD